MSADDLIPQTTRRQLAAACNLPESLVAVLWRRGLRDEKALSGFLQPSLADLPDPDLLQGMPAASRLLAHQLAVGGPVVIYADYDADGLTAGALLYLFLRRLGHHQLHYLLPHRIRDGYGLHPHLLAQWQERATGAPPPLLLTVDCGISDLKAVTAANELGFQVIITDHHQPRDELPAAAAILNPHQGGCSFPDHNLAGVGVAFYLLMGLRRRLVEQGSHRPDQLPNLKDFLDLVALGTVADMVAVTGVNRILLKAGLEVLQQNRRPGLAALAAQAGIIPGYAEDISYTLAPRLNAAGRIAEPEIAFRLLISDDPAQAATLAGELAELNRRRRAMSDRIYEEVCQDIALNYSNSQNIIMFAREEWHPGVLGIAATRLALEYDRPTILLNLENGVAKGSGRSVAGLDLLAAVTDCQGLLAGYGGHAAALGVSLPREAVADFRRHLNDRLAVALQEARSARESTTVDWFFADGRIEPGFVAAYQRLAPFGPGNPEPRFKIRSPVSQAAVVGEKHLRFQLPQPEQNYHAIAFGQGAGLPLTNGVVEFIFAFKRNFYRGRSSWQLKVSELNTAK
ncbi:MAG: single-stranded-DNA-specific exonuclease RecJ [Desulfurivibrio sp.]|nr:single-stranded-DNA-specific exonuclease RecJ [Desulfurivibrio sp.]